MSLQKFNGFSKSENHKLQSGGTSSVLSSILHSIFHRLGIGPAEIERMMQNYVTNPANKISQNLYDKSSARGNLKKEIFKNTMTWKVFCKGLRFIGMTRFRIVIILENRNKQIIRTDKIVNLGYFENPDLPVNSDGRLENINIDNYDIDNYQIESKVNKDI